VLVATGLVSENWEILIPTDSTALDRLPKIVTDDCIDYVGNPYGCAKFGADPSTGVSGQLCEICREAQKGTNFYLHAYSLYSHTLRKVDL